MRNFNIFFLLFGLFAAFACSEDNPELLPSAAQDDGNEVQISESSYQSGLLYVKIAPEMLQDTESVAFAQDMSSFGVTSIERLFPDAGEFEERHRKAGLDQWYIVNYSPVMVRTKAIQGIGGIQGIETVESPYKVKPADFGYFNDPYAYLQWNFYNDGGLNNKFLAGCDINVLPVWENFTTGSKDIIVAVIDGAPDQNNPDLAGVVIPAGENGSKNFLNNSYSLEPHLHGTHVSGIIAAINNNRTGVCGIAGGYDGTGGVKILSCQIFDNADHSGNIPKSFVWAADHGATIVNNSWCYQFDSEREARSAVLSAAERVAIDYFVANAGMDKDGNQVGPMKGGVVFFSAGNDGWQYALPASYENVVAVGAVGPYFKTASYTNYGPWCDISAPGGDYELGIKEALVFSTSVLSEGKSPYVYMQGTSMSCPHVTGVAALILSYYGGPGFTNEDLKERLLFGADYHSLQGNTKETGPMLDAYGAMTYIKDANLPEVSFADSGLEKTGIAVKSHETFTFVLNVDDNSGLKYKWISKNSGAVSYKINYKGNVEVTINAIKAEPGKYQETFKIGFSDKYSTSFTFSYTILENHPPISNGNIENVIIEKLGSRYVLDLSQYFSDEDGEALRYQAFCSSDNIVSTDVKGRQLSLTANSFGSVKLTVQALDARSKDAVQTFTVLVYNTDEPPVIGPNPVVSMLMISKGAWRDFNVTIRNATGVVVYKGLISGDYFNPATIDMSRLAPGRYGFEMEAAGQKYQSVIIKK